MRFYHASIYIHCRCASTTISGSFEERTIIGYSSYVTITLITQQIDNKARHISEPEPIHREEETKIQDETPTEKTCWWEHEWQLPHKGKCYHSNTHSKILLSHSFTNFSVEGNK